MIKLTELISVRSGLTCRRAPLADQNGNLFLLQLKDAYPDRDWERKEPLKVSVTELPVSSLLQPGDFIFRARGMRHYLLPAPCFDLPLACVSPLMSVRIHDPQRLLPAYLSWYVNTDQVQQILAGSMHRTGRLQLRTRALLDLDLPLPAPARQLEIVELYEKTRVWSEREVMLAQQRLQQATASLLRYAGEA